MARNQLTMEQKDARLGIKLVAPSVIIIGLLIIYPIIYNVYLSFFDVSMLGATKFIGVENYKNVIFDSSFWKSVLTTFIYVIATTLLTTLLGLIVAMAMNKEFPLRGLVRSIILLPYVAPVISTVYSWQFFFDPVNGIFTHVMVDVLGIYDQRFNLIADPKYALWVAIVFSMWKAFPFTYLMILSRLQTIDNNLYEAAEIDGAGGFRKFISITIPELYFVLGSIVLLRFIWNFNKFEEVYLLTDNVKVLSVYTYFKAFTGSMALGQGSALVVVQFALLIGLILFYVKKVLKW
ncbi:MAG: carbohydrate ABC transporter permease [Sphaerochaeta sp.]